jgi:hypothetical protein
MARPALSVLLSPDELKRLAEACLAEAIREDDSEQLRTVAFANALIELAETKARLLYYERRLLN